MQRFAVLYRGRHIYRTMHDITPELLRRYFKKQCTPQEEEWVSSWLNGNNGTLPDDTADVFADIDKTALGRQIWQTVQPADTHKTQKQHYQPLLSGLAASVLLLIIASGIFYILQKPASIVTQQQSRVEYQTIKAARGKKVMLTLADGTRVHLNSESELIVPRSFSDTVRTIHLLGEAFLEVAKDASRPFTVITPGVTVRVLGTVFNVRAYPDEPLARVTVQEGKVKMFNTAGHSTLLTRNQTATASAERALSVQHIDAHYYTAWHRHKLVFKDQPLAEIALTLQRWYNIRVLINNSSLANHRFTGSFDNPGLDDLMTNMSVVAQFNYKLNEKQLIIY